VVGRYLLPPTILKFGARRLGKRGDSARMLEDISKTGNDLWMCHSRKRHDAGDSRFNRRSSLALKSDVTVSFLSQGIKSVAEVWVWPFARKTNG
jgi:hypothetical protein